MQAARNKQVIFTLRGLMVVKTAFEESVESLRDYALYFPRFGKHIGSLIPNDRTSSYIFEENGKVEKYASANISPPKDPRKYFLEGEDEAPTNICLEAIDAIRENTPYKLAKHHLFTVIYILQNIIISDPTKGVETMYDVFTTSTTPWDAFDKDDVSLGQICEAVYLKSLPKLFNAFKTFAVPVVVEQNDAKVDSYLAALSGDTYDGDALNKLALKDFFQIEPEGMPGLVLPSAYAKICGPATNAEQQKQLRTNMIAYLNDVHHMNVNESNLSTKLDMINPWKCTTIREDDDALGDEFVSYTFEKAGTFRHFEHGYCYTASYLAAMIFGNRGRMDLKGLAISQSLKNEIVEFISQYYHHRQGEQSEVLSYLDEYTPYEREVLSKAVGAVERGDPSTLNALENGQSLKVDQLQTLLSALLNHYANVIEREGVKTIMKYSANTIFELLGLIGYIMLSDDITVGEATGSHFHISQYCTGILLDVFDKCQKIKAKSGSSLYDELCNVTFHNENLGRMLADLSSTCIHGMGRRFSTFYLHAYQASRAFVQEVLETRRANLDKDIASLGEEARSIYLLAPWKVEDEDGNEYEYDDDSYAEQVEKMFQLAPMFKELSSQDAQRLGYKYMTCVHYEFKPSYNVQNPLNKKYIVGMFKEDGMFHWIAYLDAMETYKQGEDKEKASSYMNPYQQPAKIHSKLAMPYEKFALFEELLKKDSGALQFELMHIPYMFQTNRKSIFASFANFTVHMCRFMTHDTPNNEAWKEYYTSLWKGSGFDEYMFEPIFPKYIATCTEEGSLWYDALQRDSYDAVSTSKENVKYIGSLQGLLALSYKQDGDNVIVAGPRGGNVRKAYQEATLIGRMLLPSKPLDANKRSQERNEELFSAIENYMHQVYGTSSTLRHNVFRTVSIDYNGQSLSLEDPNNAEGVLQELESIGNSDSVKLRAVWKIIQSIDIVNVVRNVRELTRLWRKEADAMWKNVYIHTLVQIVNICIAMQLITYSYFLILLPFNDPKTYMPLRDNPVYRDMQRKACELAEDVHAWKEAIQKETFQEDLIKSLMRPYYVLTIDVFRLVLNTEYNPDVYASTCMSFKELSTEAYMISKLQQEAQRLESMIRSIDNAGESDIHLITCRKVDDVPMLYRRYNASKKLLEDNYVYYPASENIIRNGDYQDSLPTRFTYTLRSELPTLHNHKFLGFAQFENLMRHLIFESEAVIIVDTETVERYMRKLNPNTSVDKWNGFRNVQDIIASLLLRVIPYNDGPSFDFTPKVDNYLSNLVAELLNSYLMSKA